MVAHCFNFNVLVTGSQSQEKYFSHTCTCTCMQAEDYLFISFTYMFPGALKTNCDSSTTFHTRRLRSLPPALTALSLVKLSMAVMLSSCPNLAFTKQNRANIN